MNQAADPQVPIKSLILVPALITLAITLLRLSGELLNWSSLLFNRTPGGGGALIGIVWLVPIFGFYFAHKLVNLGIRPGSTGRVFGFSFLALVVSVALFAFAISLPAASIGQFVAVAAGAAAGILLTCKGWPALTSTLLAYGVAARIPVILIMLMAILGDWGTHYDGPPPNLPEMGPFREWFSTGLIPQLTFWLAFTVILGSILGGLAVAVANRGRAPEAASPTQSEP